MDETRLREIENYDFYSGSRESFYKKNREHKAVLVQGRHWEKAPLVTILLPTCKRRDLLKEALESALRQEEVADYQIIVADNEGMPLEMETETAALMKAYTDSKVIYYRYDRQAYSPMNSVVALARSKWICFLHDDDVLAPNYLKIMLHIVRQNQDISYLSCNIGVLNYEISKRNIREFSKIRREKLTIRKAIRRGYFFYETRGNWLGALIDRQHYIDMGGIPALATGIGDHIMVGKYNDRYGIYKILDGPRLYFRRECGKGQISMLGGEHWTDCYTSKMFFYLYLARRNFPLLQKFFRYKGFALVQEDSRALRNGIYQVAADVKEIADRCHIKTADGKTAQRYCYLDLVLESMAALYGKRRSFQVKAAECGEKL